MLMGSLFGRKVRPRSFVYTPRYYDPENDPDRKDRIRFDQSNWRRTNPRKTRGNPWMLLALTAVIAGLILALKFGFSKKWDDDSVTLTPSDAAQVDTTEAVH